MGYSSFTEKYAPQTLADIIGQKSSVQKLVIWFNSWRKGKALILHGPPGVGKNSVLYALARERKLDLIEIDGSDEKDSLASMIPSLKQASLFKKGKIVAVDGAENTNMALLTKLIKESIYPVVLIVDNPYHPRFKFLRKACDMLEFKRVKAAEIEKMLHEICRKEGIPHRQQAIRSLSYSAAGDIRAALLDLESFAGIGFSRDREGNIFETLRTLFKSGNVKTALNAIESCEKDPFEIFFWVEENLAREFADPMQRAAAFDILSKADLLRRISKKSVDMLAGLSALRKPSRGFTPYRPPAFYPRTENRELVEKLAKEMHCSERIVKRELPFMRFISF
ncbi:MAG: AAA family ATPase [Candidatus Aenigmatarchaeota archaeon]